MTKLPPTLLLDVDGVLANFIQATLDIVEDVSGVKYSHDDVKTWELFNSLPKHAHLKTSVYEQLKKPGGCFGIPVYPGAVEGVMRLKEVAHVVILTSPFHGSKTWMSEREEWLEHYFGIPHGDVIHGHHKHLVFGDMLVDDKDDHVGRWSIRHPKGVGVLWDRQYNHESHLPRARTRDALYQRLLHLPPPAE